MERRCERFETEASQAEGRHGHDDTENSDLVPPGRSTPKRKRPNSTKEGIQRRCSPPKRKIASTERNRGGSLSS